jgi:hypothetical protein
MLITYPVADGDEPAALALCTCGLVIPGEEGFSSHFDAMTMSRLLLRNTNIARATFSLNKSQAVSTPLFSVGTRAMNSLQEASSIYKAFKKGGPSFGAWQVLWSWAYFHSS